MKKVTKSREFDSIKEDQPIQSGYNKKEKHSLVKSFTQQANQNLEKSQEAEVEKSEKEEYVDKPAEDTKPAKGKFVKVKKSFGNIASIEKGGPKKFPSEKPEMAMPKCEKNIDEDEKKPELGSGERFKELVRDLKKKSLGESPIIKSLDEMIDFDINNNDINELENIIKAAKDPEALAAWIGRKKYGKKRYQELAEEGKKEKSEDVEEIAEDVKGPELKLDEAMKNTPKDKRDDVLEELRDSKKEKSLNSSNGSGGDLIAPQLAGGKKRKYVKVKKSLDSKSFFVQSDCQSE